MKKHKTPYDQAASIYFDHCGIVPSLNEITDLWHKYAIDWKKFDSFRDWLFYNID